MVTYEVLYERVKNEVSEKRFKHTLGVVDRVVEYAKIYEVNIEDAKCAAILHDLAKEYSDEQNNKVMQKYGYVLDDVEQKNGKPQHGRIAALIAKNEYKLSDDIVNAIKFHTTGRANMSILEKIIYLADATEARKSILKRA